MRVRSVIRPPLQRLQPATRVQSGLRAILPHSNTPSLRVAGFEDEDEDDDEHEAPCEALLIQGPGWLQRGRLFTVQTEKQENQTQQKASRKRQGDGM
jgi:hypothetical protein